MLAWAAQNAVVTLVLAVVVVVICRVGRLGPASRHALWLVVLIKLVTPPLVAWPWAVPILGRPGEPQSGAVADAKKPDYATMDMAERLKDFLEQYLSWPHLLSVEITDVPPVERRVLAPPDSTLLIVTASPKGQEVIDGLIGLMIESKPRDPVTGQPGTSDQFGSGDPAE